jgi:hypothetical protein
MYSVASVYSLLEHLDVLNLAVGGNVIELEFPRILER